MSERKMIFSSEIVTGFEDWRKCFICGIQSVDLIEELSLIKTAHSETPINRILKHLCIKASVGDRYTDENQRICQHCFDKINECDFAYTQALKAEKELIDILKSRVSEITEKEEEIDQSSDYENSEIDTHDDTQYEDEESHEDNTEIDDNSENKGEKTTTKGYQKEWELLFTWLTQRNNSAYCTLCDRVLRNSIYYIKRHKQNKTHMSKIVNKFGLDSSILRKHYKQRYKPEWEELYSWVTEDNGTAYCKLCEKTLSNNVTNLKRHESNRHHIMKTQEKSANWKRAQKYKKEWEIIFPWLSEKNGSAYCNLCYKSLGNNVCHLKRHRFNKNHLLKQKEKYKLNF